MASQSAARTVDALSALPAAQRTALETEAAEAAERERRMQAQIEELRASVSRLSVAGRDGAQPTGLLDRYRRLRPDVLPLLEGTESAAKIESWLEQWGSLCDLNGMTGPVEADSVELAAVRLSGAAREWWRALPAAGKEAASLDRAGFAAALRERFVPMPTSEQALRELMALRQGSRAVSAYIADFTRLRTLAGDRVPDSLALFVFQEGLCTDLRDKLDVAGPETLQEAMQKAGRFGARAGRTQGAAQAPASLKHMQAEEPEDLQAQRIEQLERVMQEQINALHMQQQPQRQQRYPRDGRGGGSGRGGGGRGGMQQLPEALVEQRRKDGVCLKCGDKSHFARGCRNEPRL